MVYCRVHSGPLFQSVSGKKSDTNVKRVDQCDQKKSPNGYKSCPTIISLEKYMIDIETFTKIA